MKTWNIHGGGGGGNYKTTGGEGVMKLLVPQVGLNVKKEKKKRNEIWGEDGE